MAIILATSLYLFAATVALLVLFAFFLSVFYARKNKSKFKEYQSEIAKSHSRILKLEVANEKLQHRIDELEASTNKMRIA